MKQYKYRIKEHTGSYIVQYSKYGIFWNTVLADILNAYRGFRTKDEAEKYIQMRIEFEQTPLSKDLLREWW